MIVVDTSIWVQTLRGGHDDTSGILRTLLDADEVALPLPVRIELMSGVNRKDRPALTRALSALPILFPTETTWQQLERWVETAASAGHRFALTDLLIAALADEIGGLVWSVDDDFERMAKLKLVRVYE